MERSKAGTKEKRSPDGLSLPNQNIINKHNMVVFYKIRKNYNEIQLIKNKMDSNNREIKNYAPSPGF